MQKNVPLLTDCQIRICHRRDFQVLTSCTFHGSPCKRVATFYYFGVLCVVERVRVHLSCSALWSMRDVLSCFTKLCHSSRSASHCLLVFTVKGFMTRPVFGFVLLACCIPMLAYLKHISAAPRGVLEFTDAFGDFSLKNQSVARRPGTRQEVTSLLGSCYIKYVGLKVGKVAFYVKSNFPLLLQTSIFKPAVLCKALNCRESSSLVLCPFSFAVFDSPILQGNPEFRGKAHVDSLGACR